MRLQPPRVIYKITKDGTVTTVGSVWYDPTAIAVDAKLNIYVIRRKYGLLGWIDWMRTRTFSWKPTSQQFNSRVRDELLQANRYRTIFEVCDGAEAWRHSYNGVHPHSSLGGMTPEEFLALYEITQPSQESLAA